MVKHIGKFVLGALVLSLPVLGASSGDAAQAASSQLAGAAAFGGMSCVMMTQMAAQAEPDVQPLYMAMAANACSQASQYASAQKKNEKITEQLKMPDIQKNEAPEPVKFEAPAEADVSAIQKQVEDSGREVAAAATKNVLGDEPLVRALAMPQLASLDKGTTETPAEKPAKPAPVEAEGPPTSIPGLISGTAVTTDDSAKPSLPAGLPAGPVIASTNGLSKKDMIENAQEKSPAQFVQEASGRKSRGEADAGGTAAGGASGGGDDKPSNKDNSGDELLAKLLGAMDEKPPGAPEGMYAGEADGGSAGEAPRGQFENIFHYASYRYKKTVNDKLVRGVGPVKVAGTR